jgi:hypothetical protein
MAQKKDSKWKGTLPSYTYLPSTANSNLRHHLESHHEDEYVETCKTNGWKMQLAKRAAKDSLVQTTLDSHTAPNAPARAKFSPQLFLQYLIKFIVADDQSINVIECREFRDLLLLLRSELQEKDIPHRTKIRESIIKAWKAHFEILRKDLSAALGKVSCTADLWSDKNLRSYLCITTHWLAHNPVTDKLELRTALIAFHNVTGKHDGVNLARIVLHLLDRAGITANLGHITLDNADNNKTFMEELQHLLEARDIDFHHTDNRIMCFPHIINICCQHILAEFTQLKFSDDKETFVPSSPHTSSTPQSFQAAVKRDPIALGRSLVRVVRASGQRRENFVNTINDGNKKGHFSISDHTKIQVPLLQLLRDVKTRWDSVYYMIERLRVMRPAIDHFLASPVNQEIASHRLSDVEWAALQDFEVILSIRAPFYHLNLLLYMLRFLMSYNR